MGLFDRARLTSRKAAEQGTAVLYMSVYDVDGVSVRCCVFDSATDASSMGTQAVARQGRLLIHADTLADAQLDLWSAVCMKNNGNYYDIGAIYHNKTTGSIFATLRTKKVHVPEPEPEPEP